MPSTVILAALGVTLTGIPLAIASFAINMIVSAIVARVFIADSPGMDGTTARNPGSRQQTPPAGDNKLPVVYGSAYVGGIITDLSITSDNQQIYYVLALSEVTNTETGGTPDTFSFGNIYFGGKKVIFDATDLTKVTGLLDESTGLTDTTVAGKINFYLYKNGSNQPVNTANSAITVMSDANLVYKWDATKLMSNCCFAIIRIQYSAKANLTGIQLTKFQITNSRSAPGDCMLDYLQSTRYGAAIPLAGIDTASLTALNTYSSQTVTYTDYSGFQQTQVRFRFDGTIDTVQPIMSNMQLMANCCDCLIKYNEILGTWGVIVQQPSYTVAMDINDSNMTSSLSISPLDISNTFNVAEVKFPDKTAQDSFNSATFDLAVINPSLLFPNEPVNKQSITLPLVNDNVRAQMLANRFLEACREDLQVLVQINYVGLQLESGDVVTLTNANYGWVAKLFRIAKVIENFGDDGSVTASLTLMEFNPSVYDDANITQFTPSPNTGLSSPMTFGTIPVPVLAAAQPSAVNPSFAVNVTTSSAGITQYAEIWYSAFSNPTSAQRIFAGTTAVNANGNPYGLSQAMPSVTLTGISAGNWYFFSRMVNAIGSSDFSAASALFQWRPMTFTYAEKYLIVAYANDLVGTGITATRSGKSYYGLYNSSTSTFSSVASNYTWYLAQPTFGTTNYLAYTNRTGRTFSFGSGTAAYASGTGAFVPTNASLFDSSIWAALPDGTNFIDLDARTGQLIKTGTTTVGGGQIAVTNNSDGLVVASLQQFLNFGAGVSTYTASAAQLTIDIYGRVVGFTAPDGFYYSAQYLVATAGQTVFTPTARGAGYIAGQDFIFKNGVLLDTSEYTETAATFTVLTASTVGDNYSVLSLRSLSTQAYYQPLNILYASQALAVVTYSQLPYQNIAVGDVITFANTGTPTQYTVSAVNLTTKTITFSTTPTGITAGTAMYRYRAASSVYRSFSRFTATLTAASTYTPTTFQLNSGFELLFLNGTIVNEQDYDIVGNQINNFPSAATGNLTIIQFAPNNLGVANGSPANVVTNTTSGVATYPFSYDANAFELYNNGLIFTKSVDYNTGTGNYTLTNTPTTNLNILVQETFDRTGAA